MVSVVERIPHRELRNRSSQILREVAAGATYEITNHGEVVAILSPPAHAPPPLRYREATRFGGWSDLPKVKISRPSQEILDELREDTI